MKGDKRMAKYIAKRVALAIVTLLVLTSVVFVLVRLMPGDPFSSDKMTPEIKANLEAYYGLDKPLAEQYITYMKNVLHGDLGYSMKYESQTVNRIIADSFPYSADLGVRSLCFALFFGLILGIVAALNRGKKLDFVCILIAIIGTSIPDFIMGSVLYFSISSESNGRFFRLRSTQALSTQFYRQSRLDSIHWHPFPV